MFKTSIEPVFLIIKSMCPSLIFVNVPEYIEYDGFLELFDELEISVVDLLMTKSSLNTINQIVSRNINVNCPTAIIGDIDDYENLVNIFGDDYYAYIHIYPNNKKEYVKLVGNVKETKDLLEKYKKRLSEHSAQRPLILCLV